MNIISQPLSWYVEKIERCEPFTSLLYGDGEFLVASGRRTGATMQNGEVVTARLADEMKESLLMTQDDPGTPIYRATDPFIADPSTYGGRDIDSVKQMHESMMAVGVHILKWYDGTVWEKASMAGELGPLLKVLKKRDTTLVANHLVMASFPIPFNTGVTIPEKNACAAIDSIETQCSVPWSTEIVIVCAGLMTIPLIARMRAKNPFATYLDLGSTFDVFAMIGSRGWQQELYADGVRYREVLEKHRAGMK